MKPFNAQQSEQLDDLWLNLRNAYWYASTIQDKDLLTGLADSIFQVRSRNNQRAISDKDALYTSKTEELSMCVAQLNEVKTRINRIIQQVDMAATLLQSLNKGLAILASA